MNEANHFVPTGGALEEVLPTCTHIGIGAHPDDLEILAFDGIAKAYESSDHHFLGIVMSSGSGATKAQAYKSMSDKDYAQLRWNEQKAAAKLGHYAAVLQMTYESSTIKDVKNPEPTEKLKQIISQSQAQKVYTHAPFDGHATHRAVCKRVCDALQENKVQPAVYGVEVWRSLDWLPEAYKVTLVNEDFEKEQLLAALMACYVSQNADGKNYDEGLLGRRKANHSFGDPHGISQVAGVSFAMDLAKLINSKDESLHRQLKKIQSEFAQLIENELQIFEA